MAIVDIEHGSKASSQLLNDNFHYLQDLVGELSIKIDGSEATVDSKIATSRNSLQNEISTLETEVNNSIAELEESVNSTGKTVSELDTNIYTNLGLNVHAIVYISSGYVAPKSGWVYVWHKNTSDNQSLAVYLDGTEVFASGDSGTWSTNLISGCTFYVGKGQTITYSGSGSNSVRFFPCKGGK